MGIHISCYTGLTICYTIPKRSPGTEMARVDSPSEGTKSFILEGVSG